MELHINNNQPEKTPDSISAKQDFYVLHIGTPENFSLPSLPSVAPVSIPVIHEKKSEPTIKTPVLQTTSKKSFRPSRVLTPSELERLKSIPTPKEFFSNIFRRTLASATIFAAIFLIMNYSAYYQIAENKIKSLTGSTKASTFDIFEEPQAEQESVEILPLYKDATYARKKIADLSMQVAPPDVRLVIPRIEKNVPVVTVKSDNLIKKNWNGLEKDIMTALQNGVIHYPGTAMPGQKGNVVITGHSSYFPWDAGQFKDVFALLHEVKKNDKMVLYYNQKKYIYEVVDIQTVKPNNTDVLQQTEDDRLTLITCTPVGTNLNRLIVIAKLIEIQS